MRRMQEAIGACRDEIKGAAILWVVFFHAQLRLGGLLYDVQKIGYGGVDMFLFLSGFGLYHSLSRDADAGRYLLRRARRLLPAYLPFCVVWLCVMLPLSIMTISPGATSRTNSKPQESSAQLSDATAMPQLLFPMQSGR